MRGQAGSEGGDPRPSHLDEAGRVHMVDVGGKEESERMAVARGRIWMNAQTLEAVRTGRLGKGDALAVARIAGIMAAKQTGDWIPLCHPLRLTGTQVAFRTLAAEEHGERDLSEGWQGLEVQVSVTTRDRTGVEMEALTGVSAALLTLYDMCKSLQRDMVIDTIRLVIKQGGRSGEYRRPDELPLAEFDADRL